MKERRQKKWKEGRGIRTWRRKNEERKQETNEERRNERKTEEIKQETNKERRNKKIEKSRNQPSKPNQTKTKTNKQITIKIIPGHSATLRERLQRRPGIPPQIDTFRTPFVSNATASIYFSSIMSIYLFIGLRVRLSIYFYLSNHSFIQLIVYSLISLYLSYSFSNLRIHISIYISIYLINQSIN